MYRAMKTLIRYFRTRWYRYRAARIEAALDKLKRP